LGVGAGILWKWWVRSLSSIASSIDSFDCLITEG